MLSSITFVLLSPSFTSKITKRNICTEEEEKEETNIAMSMARFVRLDGEFDALRVKRR
jgi:hypothetical protein